MSTTTKFAKWWLPLMLGILATAAAAWTLDRYNQSVIEAHTAQLADDAEAQVRQRFALFEYGLRGARGAVVTAGVDSITRRGFEAYSQTREIGREFPGALGFGFIRRVPVAQEAAFIAHSRADGPSDFAIRALTPHNGDRFVIQYIYPAAGNEKATGLDIASEANRHTAALAAAREGQPQLTAPITLVQADNKPRQGFLILLPIYARDAKVQTAEDRENAVVGWSYAPLVADQVLADLDPRLSQITLQLTQSGQTAPFYTSSTGSPSTAEPAAVKREINVLGQRWTLAASPTAALREGLGLWSYWWAIWLGIAITCVSLWWGHMRQFGRDSATQSPDTDVADDGRFRTFLRSALVARSWPPVAVAIGLIFTIGSWQIWQNQLQEVNVRLLDTNAQAVQRMTREEERYRRHVLFLAATPPLQGLIRSLPTGKDPTDGSTVRQWKERMFTIFQAYMQVTPEVFQVRLIQAKVNGQEIVNILRQGDSVLAMSDGAIQMKGITPYLQAASQLGVGKVYVSNITLNREYDAIEIPHRPAWRFVTPIYGSDGNLFGLLLINVQADTLLRDIAKGATAPSRMYVTNNNQDFLHHPDSARTFGFELGQPYRWQDEFKPMNPLPGFGVTGLGSWDGAQGDVWASETSYRPTEQPDDGRVRFFTTTEQIPVHKAMAAQVLLLLLGLGSIGLLGVGLQYRGWWLQRQRQVGTLFKQKEAMQHQESALFKGLVDSSPDATLIVDQTGTIQIVNSQAERLFGYDRLDLLGHSIHKLLPARLEQAHKAHLQGYLKSPVARDMGTGKELLARRADGTEFAVEISLGPVQLKDRVLVSASVRDVTERNRAAQALQSANERLSLAVESAGIGVWEYDLLAGTLAWDDQMYALYGLTRSTDTNPYALWRDNIHPDDRAATELALTEAIDGKRSFNTQFRSFWAEGSIRHLKADARVVRDASGAPLRMIGVNRDMTDQVTTSAALLANEKLLQRVGSLANIGGWRVDLQAGTVHWSEQTRMIHETPPGYVPSLAAGIDFYAPEERGLVQQAVQHAIESGTGWELEVRFITYTGRSLWVRSQGEVEYEQGRVAYLVGAFQDISTQREARELLKQAKLAADSSNAAKSAFLANTSHEIRTPLNAIIGLTYILAEDHLSEAQHKLVTKVQLSGRALLGIVNDVLDLSKIEADEMTLEEEPLQLRELLEELAGIFAPQAEAKGLQINLDLDTALPKWVATDSTRLRQILTNLLGNALKFTAMGEIRIGAQVLPAKPDQALDQISMRFTVADSGMGISAEAQARLFQPFTQADTSTTRRFGGTGLGLSIVKKLVHLLGGEVGVDSHEGVGSSFWVNVTLRIPSAPEITARDEQISSLSLLIAEDDPNDAQRLEKITRALGWLTQTVPDGAALVQALVNRHNNGLRLPDALIVDWQMPHMDGLQALTALAQQVGRDMVPAVLMVSAHDKERIAALDKGHLVDRILHKPLDPSELFNAVNDAVTNHTGNSSRVLQATRTETIKARWLPGVRVLVADDTSLNLEVVSLILARNGAVVTTADNGEAALAHLQAAPDGFDVVLMDVQMPHMDGLEATRQVRERLGLRTLPIIGLTAGALVEEKRRALEAGMNDFLTKPVDPSQLINRLRMAVETYRGKGLAIEALAGSAASADDGDWPDIKGLNSTTAKRLLDGDAPLLMSTLERLLDEYANLETPPATDVDHPGADKLRLQMASQVHKLRSASGMIGAERMYELAGQAENALRTPDQPAQAVLVQLADSIRELREVSARVLRTWREGLEAASATAQAGESAVTLSTQALQQLQGLLAVNDLAALEWVAEHAPALREAMGSAKFKQLQACLQRLDYEQARALLAPLAEKIGAKL